MNIAMKQPEPHTAQPVTNASEINMIPLADCMLSPLNPRQQDGDLGIEALAASIEAVGLLQNLAGWQPDGKPVEIVAGGRRLRALQQLAEKAADDPATVLVPAVLATDETEARQMASTENVARLALHPADEITAYRDLRDMGMETPEIAKAFAVTERHVRGRLRLAGLAHPILEALLKDEITLDVAAAYTVNADRVAQAAVFAQLSASWGGENTTEIRRRLAGDAVNQTDKLVKLIGREAYEEAGGEVREDLFGTDCYFTDPALLLRLAEDRLRDKVDALTSSGWGWVTASLERPDYEVTSALTRTYPERVTATDEEAERYDVLADLIEADEANEDKVAEWTALSERLDAEHFTPEQMTLSGVFLWVDWNGEIASGKGFVRVEDQAAAEAAGICRSRHVHTATAAKPRGPYSQAVLRDLARVRTAAFQSAMLQQPDLALDLLTFVLSEGMHGCHSPLGLTIQLPENAPEHEPGLRLPKALQATDCNVHRDADDLINAFNTFRRRKPATKSRLLTEAVARLLSIGLADDHPSALVEHLAKVAGINVRSVWTPTEAFLSRLRKDTLLGIHQEIMGNPAPSMTLGKQPKDEIVAWLDMIFSSGHTAPNLSEERQARVDSWVPEGLVSMPKP